MHFKTSHLPGKVYHVGFMCISAKVGKFYSPEHVRTLENIPVRQLVCSEVGGTMLSQKVGLERKIELELERDEDGIWYVEEFWLDWSSLLILKGFPTSLFWIFP